MATPEINNRNEKCFKIALRLRPNWLKLLHLMGDYYFRNQDFSTALTHYNTAIEQASKRSSSLLPYLQKQAAICLLNNATTNRTELEHALELLQSAIAAYKKEGEYMGYENGESEDTNAVANLIKNARERLTALSRREDITASK